ncbi:MAG: 30S ribosomal protein S17 [Planctomycetes bacterium]|nr:30S ribosomal protein S17 [Planctomycetota bacterium]
MTSTGENKTTKSHRSLTATVSLISGDKTISVQVETMVKHPRYGKWMRRRKKLIVHDPANVAAVGDVVEIRPCRAISKRKSWRLVRVVRAYESETRARVERSLQ